jgi:hypothetical protein
MISLMYHFETLMTELSLVLVFLSCFSESEDGFLELGKVTYLLMVSSHLLQILCIVQDIVH